MKSKYWNIHTVWILAVQLVYSACSLPDHVVGSYEVDEAYWQPGEAFGKPEVLTAGQLNSDPSTNPSAESEEDYYDPSRLNQDQEGNYFGNGGITPMWDPIMGWRMSYPWGNGIGLNNSLALGYSLSPWGSYPYYGYSPFANNYNMMWGNSIYTAPYYGNYYGTNPYWNSGVGTNWGGQGNGSSTTDPMNTTQVPRTPGSGAAQSGNGTPVIHHRPKASLPSPSFSGERKDLHIQENARTQTPTKESGKVWRDLGKVLDAAVKATDSGVLESSPSRGGNGGRGSFESPSSSPSRGSISPSGISRPSTSPSRSAGGKRP